MKIERTKNASRNIVFGLGLKIYQIVVPFLMRSAMLYFMGVEYLGLNSLFTSILQVLNLAELGVGAAMVYSMYKPIAEDDNDTLCALLLLYKKYYAIIGGVIAFFGICFTPFLPKLIKGNVPDSINIYILYLLNLGATVLSYWLYAYKNSVLQAHQRNDVVSKINICTDTVKYIIQILVLWLFKNYYLYVITILTTQTLSNIVTAYFANKIFPKVVPRGNLEKEKIKAIQKRIRDLFTSKLGAVVVNSADTVVISAFLGLKVLAIYQNYFFIIFSIIGLLDVIFVSCMAGIGNSLIVEDKNKNFNDLNTFLFLIVWISGIVTCCLLNVFQPFIKLWTGESLMLEYGCVICFCIYFFMYEVNRLLNMYKDAGGIWHEDRFRPLVTALCNLG